MGRNRKEAYDRRRFLKTLLVLAVVVAVVVVVSWLGDSVPAWNVSRDVRLAACVKAK